MMKKIYLLSIFCLFLIQIVPAQTWSKKSNGFPGDARTNAVSFVIGDNAYIGLGYNSESWFNSIYYNDFWKYDSKADAWSKIADFPESKKTNAVAFSINGKGYVGLGSTEDSSFSQSFYEYDPATDTWTKIADYPGGERHSSVAFTIGDAAYVGTGMTPEDDDDGYYVSTNEFWKYENSTWTKIASIPNSLDSFYDQDRYDATAFSLNGFGYVAGGTSGGFYISAPSNICKYDPATDTWTQDLFSHNLGTNTIWSYTLGNEAVIQVKYGCYKYNSTERVLESIDHDPYGIGDEAISGILFFVINNTAYMTFTVTGSFFSPVYNTDLWFYEDSSLSCLETSLPTPTELSYLNNKLEIKLTEKAGICKIYDLNGLILIEKELFAGSNTIDFTDITNKVCIVSVETANNKCVRKIIK